VGDEGADCLEVVGGLRRPDQVSHFAKRSLTSP
jgi:hypothetical protein